MASFVGVNGAVTSWANNTQFITTGSEPIEFDLNMEGLEFDTTAFAAAGISTYINGLSSWAGQIRQRLKTAQTGDAGLVEWTSTAGNYATNIKRWSLAVEVDPHETTAFATTPPTARTFIPGKLRWGGEFDGYLDGTTAATQPVYSATTNPATLTLRLRDLATDDALSGSAFTTRAPISVSPGGVATIGYSYRGSGNLTQSTPTSGTTVFPTGAVAIPTAGSLVLTAASGRTYTGSAFWTRVTIENAVNEMAAVTIDFQGSGVLTIA